MINLYVKGYVLKEKVSEFLKDESGMGVIEIAIIIIVLIGIALIFKSQITGFVRDLLDTITNESISIDKSAN